MSKKRDEINPQMIANLEELRDAPTRDPHLAARGRAHFLAEAATLLPAVSGSSRKRHKDWRTFSRKERLVMNTVLSIVIAIAVFLGGGATVAAAQNDLPNQPLYPVKTFSENIWLWLNANPQSEIGMLMELVQTRVNEMNALAAMGITPPAKVEERLNQHIAQALQIAAGMDDENMHSALLQIQNNLREQVRTIAQLQTQTTGETSQVMLQIRTMLETRLRLIDEGLTDPNGFRDTVRNEEQQRTGQTETAPHRNQPAGTSVLDGNGKQGMSTPQGPNQPAGTTVPGGKGEQATPQGPNGTCTCTPQGPQNGSTPTPGATGNPNSGSSVTPQGTGGTENT